MQSEQQQQHQHSQAEASTQDQNILLMSTPRNIDSCVGYDTQTSTLLMPQISQIGQLASSSVQGITGLISGQHFQGTSKFGLYDIKGNNEMKNFDFSGYISQVEQDEKQSQLIQGEQLSDETIENKKQHVNSLQFGETWSILRFVKGNKSKGLEISSSEIGVFNPVTKKEVLTQFKTTTPRVITVLLDLNENVLKFWLNDRRNSNKNIKLTTTDQAGQTNEVFTGPWIPCIKIEKEKNKIILNPYAKEPTDFYEKDFDKKFNINKYILPFLYNMVCVTNLPLTMNNSKKEAAIQLKELFAISSHNINQILMPSNKNQSTDESIKTNENNTNNNSIFCFIQFHLYDALTEFLNKNKNNTSNTQYKIYSTNEIIQWFSIQENDLPSEIKEPFDLLKVHINIPSLSSETDKVQNLLTTINNSYLSLTNLQDSQNNNNNIDNNNNNPQLIKPNINLISQQFSDKLIIIKDSQVAKLSSRDCTTNEFELETVNFSDPPQDLNGLVQIKVKRVNLLQVFKTLNWTQIIKLENSNFYGIVQRFFEALNSFSQITGEYVIAKIPLIIAKIFIEVATQQTQSQLDRIRRYMNNFTSIVPASYPLTQRQEPQLEDLKSFSFYLNHNHSVEDLYQLLSILYDLNEQLWAQTRSIYCPPEVKQLMTSTSRPNSAFNRLGSYITWGLKDISSIQMCNNGFYYKETSTIQQFCNQALDISEFSKQSVFDQDVLQETLGNNNRFLKSLVNTNVPLYKTINYLCPQRMFSGLIQDVISSQNSGFVIFCGQQGQIQIANTLLDIVPLKIFNFFSEDINKKQQKYIEIIQKIESRKDVFDEYKKSILKKSAILSIAKDIKPFGGEDQQQQTAQVIMSKSQKKKEMKLKKIQKTKQNKQQLIKQQQSKQTQNKSKSQKQEHKKSAEVSQLEIIQLASHDSVDISQIQVPQKQLNNVQDDIQVLGYFLLSKSAIQKAIDPLLVGCVYHNKSQKKYFIKVRKIIFLLHYLQNFITMDSSSGLQVNKLSGKHIIDTNQIEQLYEEVLNNHDVVVDLYSIFMRNQVLKQEWPKKDTKFQILTDISEAEIEIGDSQEIEIIDFIKCSYSITNQNTIHMLVQQKKNENTIQKLLQFYINEQKQFEDETQIMQIDIKRGKEMDLEEQYARILQYDNKVLLIGESQYQILNQEDFKPEINKKLDENIENTQRISIINESSQNDIFNKDNLEFIRCLEKLPEQNWQLIWPSSKDGFVKVNLKEIQQLVLNSTDQNQEQIEEFDLKQCPPNDILLIANLLESKYIGSIAKNKENYYITSSGIDQQANLYSHHSFYITQQQQNQEHIEFELSIPQKYQQTSIREIEFEFSFANNFKDQIPIKNLIKRDNTPNNNDQLDVNNQQQNKRIPLSIESIVGAQISDQIQPCYLAFPDNQVFSSNYPSPEFVFKHYSGKTFMISQFIIKSKENREWNGVPVSQGLIFISESLEELQNTKQFAKFTEKEYKLWRQQRDQFQNIPFQSCEPYFFFDMGENTEITINIPLSRACRYIKLIPTAFRKKPINFTSKPFNTNQAEIQFFGINGVEIQAIQRGVSTANNDQIYDNIKEIEIVLNGKLLKNQTEVIGDIQKLQINEIRTSKPQNSVVQLIALSEIPNYNTIGATKHKILLKDAASYGIKSFILQIPKINENDNWQLKTVTMSIKAFNDSAVIFTDKNLEKNKLKLRQYLLDANNFQFLLQALINIVQDQDINEEMKKSCLQCFLNFIRNIGRDKNLQDYIQLFKQRTKIELILSDRFIEMSQNYQSYAIKYLEIIGELQNQKEYIFEFIKKQIEKLLLKCWNKNNVSQFFELIQWCNNEQQQEIYKILITLFFDKICSEYLPIQQHEQNIILRQKLNIDAFPYDDIIFNDQLQSQQNSSNLQKTFDGYMHLLNCRFELYKLNTLYHYNIDFYDTCLIDKIKLFFEQDTKNLYKIGVKILIPDSEGFEQIYLNKIYDENTYTQICEKAHIEENIQYFSQINNNDIQSTQSEPKQDQNIQKSNEILIEKVDLNCLTIDLQSYIGRYLKIQIELIDSYRTVHKPNQCTQILIRPEFYGESIDSTGKDILNNDLSSKKYGKYFEVSTPDQQNFLTKKSLGNIEYSIYSIPNNQQSLFNKAFLFTQNTSQILAKGKSNNQDEQQEDNQKHLINKRKELTSLIQLVLHNNDQQIQQQIKQKVQEIQELQLYLSRGQQQQDAIKPDLSLQYLIGLSDILSYQLLKGIKQNPTILDSKDLSSLYLLLFNSFAVKDQISHNKNVQLLLDLLFDRIPDKTKLIFSIIEHYLFEQNVQINQQNIISFIQSSKAIQINELLQQFIEYSGVDQIEPKMESQEDYLDQIDIMQSQNEFGLSLITNHQLLLFLNLIDDIKLDQNNQEVDIGLIIQIMQDFLGQGYPKNLSRSKSQLIVQYGLTIIQKLLDQKKASLSNLLVSQLSSLLNFIQLCIQMNSSLIVKLLKKVILDINKKLNSETLTQLIGYILLWYQNKENMTESLYYFSYESQKQGKGAGQFIKHFSIIFKLYIKMLQISNSQESLTETYKKLSGIISDILEILVKDKDQINYEEDYFIVWVQIYQSMSFLDRQTLEDNVIFDQFAINFYQLPSILQEALYIKFHQKTEKLCQGSNKDPTILLQIVKAFLFQGFKDRKTINTAYQFCEGLLNIIQTGKKDTHSTTVLLKFDSYSVILLLQTFATYLNNFINKGIYYGVVGSQIETMIKLELGNQLALILVNATNSSNQNAYEDFVLNNIEHDDIIRDLLEWIFINYQKGKNLPSGERIYSICSHVETIICKLSANDNMVNKCLPMLMKTVLDVDNKLRQCLKASTINCERAIQIQKTINNLFLTFFKTWVHNDQVAKKFLLELNGFDFLLDRLFPKRDTSSSSNLDSQPWDHAPEESKDGLISNSDDDETIHMINIIKQKLDKNFKPQLNQKRKENKQLPGVLPPISKKQTAMIPSVTENIESGDNLPFQQDHAKDMENQLQVEDFGRSMKLIWSSDKEKQIQSQHSTTQWNKFKTGSKNRIFNYQISDQKFEYEYILQFDLEKVIEISEIYIGLLYNWSTYDVDAQYEPLTFILEGGKTSQEKADWKVILKPIMDRGYMLNSIIVYGYNFIESTISDMKNKLEQSIDSIGKKECRYITLKMRKPIMACLESSIQVGTTKKIKSYGISYISVMGVQIEQKPIFSYLVDLQKDNSLEILSKFFSGEFTEAFGLISQQPQIIEKIKSAFDKLSILLDSKASLVKPIFLSMCSKNQGLSDWIMLKRLISLDEKSIKKEQIKFLGDIISSNKETQLEKLTKIQEFILKQINLSQMGKLTLNPEKQILLSRFINLYCHKMREFSSYYNHLFNSKEEITSSIINNNIELEFTVEDLESAVALMSSCDASKSNKFFNSLTKFILILLSPPKPFINLTININDYVIELLQSDVNMLQNLLFSSIIASTNSKALDVILQKDKVSWVVSKLQSIDNLKNNSAEGYQLVQVLYNCSKQKHFRDLNSQSLTFQLYDFLKSSDQQSLKLLRQDAEDYLITLVVQSIKDLVVGYEDLEEKLSQILTNDITKASEKADVDFINKIIVPILHAEQNIPITISIYDVGKKNQGLMPIYTSPEVESKGPSFFLKTEIMNQKQKQVFQKSFKEIAGEKVEGFNKMVESKWDLVFNSKQQQIDSSKFRQFIQATQNKQNLIILASVTLNGAKAVLGGFCQKPFPSLGEAWAHEFDYQIPYGEGNFVFYYTPEKELHFTMTHNKPFGYIYTDYEEGGALSVSGDFFLISWSYEFQNSCGNIYDMKCIEEPSIMTFYSNMEIQNFEIWCLNSQQKSNLEEGRLKHELKKSTNYYTKNSPYNFFRENLVFEVNKDLTLEQVTKEILGKSQVYIKYPQEEAEINQQQTLQELYSQEEHSDSILDLVIIKKAEAQQQTNNAQVTTDEKQQQKNSNSSQIIVGTQEEEKSIIDVLSIYDEQGVEITKEAIKQTESNQDKQDQEAKQQQQQQPQLQQQIQIIINKDQQQQSARQPILKKFEEKGGILHLIKAAKTAVKFYKNEKIKEMWSLWLNEIESFSQLPTFFQTFSQNREKEQIVYKLLQGDYDKQAASTSENQQEQQRVEGSQEELHIEMVKYSYKIVNEVFEKHEGAELREQCLKNGTLERFIERIGQLSSEKRRVKINKEEQESNSKQSESEESSSPNKTQQIEKGEKKHKHKKQDDQFAKRKGVGYTTGVGTTWNVNEYLKSKEAKNSQAANIVNILKHVIKSKDWEAPPQIKDLILESALLPTLESAFRSGSLLEMAKDFDLNMAYLGFVQELANHSSLIDILQEIGPNYEPLQKESILVLLVKLSDLSQIFISCLTTDISKPDTTQDDQAQKPKLLAEKIIETKQIVAQKVQQQESIKKQQSLQEILAMDLHEAYFKLLASQRFDYMSMKDSSGIYTHAYQMELVKNTNPPVTKLVRLAQEIADLSNSLPCDYTNGIFCRVDKERVDMMKCLIMGASGTPYAHGAFLYDLFFENQYPNVPPKCQLQTTGNQTVRFNPNLYHNGKVCLSLLGTWRGSSTENWDPKLSTILQVLLSIQAIIMSNEVYFNEPGYEHEAGTPEGEKKNEGYANIVRYCNVKFAIIEAIKNPPLGFEKVIKRNFYLKKNEVLNEVKEWVDRSKTHEAIYTGLVYDHNYQWAPQISQEGKYPEMMDAIYKELKETLENIPSPFEDETTGEKLERKFSKRDDEVDDLKAAIAGGDVKFDHIDVSYDQPGKDQEKELNINDEKVKDRWSRYIGAMGIDAVAKQAESRVMIMGLGPLGIEIAKNIVLAGCKELIIHDNLFPTQLDLSGQFFIQKKDLQNYLLTDSEQETIKTRADCCKDKLQQLNLYVKVTVLSADTNVLEYIKQQKDLKIFVYSQDLTFQIKKQVLGISQICREKGIHYIQASQNGLFGKIFNDFGEDFIVIDKNGEELQECMIQDITNDAEGGIVTILEGLKHKYEDGDQVIIKEVIGMDAKSQENLIINKDETQTINGSIFTIKQINPRQFRIGDTSQFTPYIRGGIAKQIKVSKTLNFKSLDQIESLETNNIPFDQNMFISDFEKLDHTLYSHLCHNAYLEMTNKYNDYDTLDIMEEISQKFEELTSTINDFHMEVLKQVNKYESLQGSDKLDENKLKALKKFAYIFWASFQGYLPPLSAFLGGVVAQEIIKGITQKFTPINQYMYIDCIELYPDFDIEDEKQIKEVIGSLQLNIQSQDLDCRYQSIQYCLGQKLVKQIQNSKVFMIGAGAIGCELLKNFAMLGVGCETDGQIILTDPDVIEVSNLNRQFLFREKHLRQPKSTTAAASAIQMNPDLKNHISARLDKIHDGTSHIYNETFFKQLTIVMNALDNVQARLYIDQKCVNSRTPLIDSGTLGPKGHVQLIIPFKTESYSSQNDPEDNTQIPHCTLKMFPEETLHCVEWAKDIFGKLFTLQSQSYNKQIFETDADAPVNFHDSQEMVSIKKVLKVIEHKPTSFSECIKMARDRFQKYAVNDIKQLLHVYPLDKTTKEGRPFWSLPKRPPHHVEYNPEDQNHIDFIASCACLYATIYNIEIPFTDKRSQVSKNDIANQASQYTMKEFVPNDQKSSLIEQQVEKEKNAQEEQNPSQQIEQQEPLEPSKDLEQVQHKYQQLILPLKQQVKLSTAVDGSQPKLVPMKVEEFEKDNDQNFHIDFISSLANLRAKNYQLDPMDWITVKIKAGRIIPALASTTAAIAGLQTIEMIKIIKGCNVKDMRNSFLNLAVPSLMMSEPGAPTKTKIKEGLEVTLWDRWEFENATNSVTLLEVIQHFESKYGLSSRDVFYGSVPLFLQILQGKSKEEKQKNMDKALKELVGIKENIEHIDLTITFVDENVDKVDEKEKIIDGVPSVRVVFKKDN